MEQSEDYIQTMIFLAKVVFLNIPARDRLHVLLLILSEFKDIN